MVGMRSLWLATMTAQDRPKNHDGIGQNGNLDAHALLLVKLEVYSRADDRLQ
jgi:hypothetical protein